MASLFSAAYGCRPDTDVTSSPEYGFKPFVGTAWKTKVKVAIVQDPQPYPTVLLPPKWFDSAHPQYTPTPDRIVTVLPVGTRLRIDRLIKDNGNWGGVTVVATLDDGTNPNRSVGLHPEFLAKNIFIWPGESVSKTWDVANDMLKKYESE